MNANQYIFNAGNKPTFSNSVLSVAKNHFDPTIERTRKNKQITSVQPFSTFLRNAAMH